MIVNPCGHISPVRAVLGAGYILVWVNGFMGLVGNSVERGDNSPSCREKKKTTQGGRSVVHQETVKRLVVMALVYRSAIAGKLPMKIYKETLPDSINMCMCRSMDTKERFIIVNKNLPEEVQKQLINEYLTEYQLKHGEKF